MGLCSSKRAVLVSSIPTRHGVSARENKLAQLPHALLGCVTQRLSVRDFYALTRTNKFLSALIRTTMPAEWPGFRLTLFRVIGLTHSLDEYNFPLMSSAQFVSIPPGVHRRIIRARHDVHYSDYDRSALETSCSLWDLDSRHANELQHWAAASHVAASPCPMSHTLDWVIAARNNGHAIPAPPIDLSTYVHTWHPNPCSSEPFGDSGLVSNSASGHLLGCRHTIAVIFSAYLKEHSYYQLIELPPEKKHGCPRFVHVSSGCVTLFTRSRRFGEAVLYGEQFQFENPSYRIFRGIRFNAKGDVVLFVWNIDAKCLEFRLWLCSQDELSDPCSAARLLAQYQLAPLLEPGCAVIYHPLAKMAILVVVDPDRSSPLFLHINFSRVDEHTGHAVCFLHQFDNLSFD